MKVKVIDADGFSYIFRTLEEFIDEVTLDFSQEGLKIKGIDPSRVVFIDILIPPGFFEEFNVEKEEKIGIKLEDLTDVLKTAKKTDTLYLETDENQNIKITLDGEYERTFSFPSITTSELEAPNLNLEFPFRAKALTVSFTEIIDELDDIGGDSVTFKAQGGKLYITANSDLGNATIELSTENGGLLESEGGDAESTYGLEYIVNTSKMRKPSDTVEIAFGSQIPLKLRYNLPQGGYADFYIAPRAE